MNGRTQDTWPPKPFVVPLPGIFPPRTHLILDAVRRVTLVLQQDREEHLTVISSSSLTPSATKLLVALVQTYPEPCSYDLLFAALYPSHTHSKARLWDQDLALRPIRRGMWNLAPALKPLGLLVVSVRKHGYVLTGTTPLRLPSTAEGPLLPSASGRE